MTITAPQPEHRHASDIEALTAYWTPRLLARPMLLEVVDDDGGDLTVRATSVRWVPWLDAKAGNPGEKSIPVRFSKER